jgi:inner membrane transporter RhtA
MKLPAPALAVLAMVSVQLGIALGTNLFPALGPAGLAWLRLTFGAIILLAVTRPRIRSFSRVAMLNTLLLGVSIGLSTLTFTEAIARIPLGTASAIEFLGPLSVAAVRAHRRSALVWPALALVGVVALTQPWLGELNVAGIAFAAAAACSWAGYIIFTQRVGTQENGLQGLALSIATAAVVVAPFGAWHAVHALTPVIALQGLGLAILVPLLPFALEMLALRRMTLSAFGTLAALEPGIATVFGVVLLGQTPVPIEAIGLALVIVAGIGAQQFAQRPRKHDAVSPDAVGPDVADPDVAGPDVAGPDAAGPDVANSRVRRRSVRASGKRTHASRP